MHGAARQCPPSPRVREGVDPLDITLGFQLMTRRQRSPANRYPRHLLVIHHLLLLPRRLSPVLHLSVHKCLPVFLLILHSIAVPSPHT